MGHLGRFTKTPYLVLFIILGSIGITAAFADVIINCVNIGECADTVIIGNIGENLIVNIQGSGNDNMEIVDPVGGDLVINLFPNVNSQGLTVSGGNGPITINTSTNSLDNSCEIQTAFPSLVTLTGPDTGNCTIIDLDSDDDGILNNVDNCTMVSNPGQEDLDADGPGDGTGDACDLSNNLMTDTFLFTNHIVVGDVIVQAGVTLTVSNPYSLTLNSVNLIVAGTVIVNGGTISIS